jgi:hypothetical protein
MEKIKNFKDLVQGIRGPGLLTVSEGGIGYPEFIAGIDGDELMVKIYPANLVVGKDIPLEIGFRDIDQFVFPEMGVLVVEHLFVGIPAGHNKSPLRRKGSRV